MAEWILDFVARMLGQEIKIGEVSRGRIKPRNCEVDTS